MIVNLTQHPATPEQVAAGVADLRGDMLAFVRESLTFDVLPDAADIAARAHDIAQAAIFNDLDDDDAPVPDQALIGGAMWLMAPLASELRGIGIEPVFAFSVRDTAEQPQPDGSVRKSNIFRHAGFVPAIV